MKRALTALAFCVLVTSVTGTVRAEEKTRFESTGFLQSLDLFITKQIDKLRGNNTTLKTDSEKDLKLSLRDTSDEKASGFLYLKDKSSSNSVDTVPLSERPDFSSLLSSDGSFRSGRDLFGTQNKLGLMLGASKEGKNDGLLLGLESNYRLAQPDYSVSSAFADITSDFNTRHASVSFLVGYSGFNIDASFNRDESLFHGNGSGYDVGLSYNHNKWSARLSLSEYKRGVDLFGIENEARSIISVELGARYRLSDNLGLQGSVRVYDYSQRMMINPGRGEFSQMILLGGRLTF
ncbi:hypothetical protein GCM10017044_06830 [Kordiimonas sediminis]|uniref:Porin domain-containing protein n=1 Tax=Kordiimonas sediminis TaxID=1735581 RepID=A0A919E5T6_9PROT|nr:porin [Kordiimonas sediminis]GHF15323.1 hypothetical protein GCM10017044_06830 [Kordiimonas sediminis]